MYLTDPRVPDPLGGHNRSTFLGDIPYTRVPGGEAGYDFTRTSMVSRLRRAFVSPMVDLWAAVFVQVHRSLVPW